MIKIRMVIFILCLAILMGTNPLCLQAEEHQEPKAILVIMDYVDIQDLLEAETPAIDSLAQKSSTGLINIRARNRYPSSSYLSIAVGSRALAPAGSENFFHTEEYIFELPHILKTREELITAGELYHRFTGNHATPGSIVNVYIEPIKRIAQRSTPPLHYSQLAEYAQSNNLQITVIGNSDSMTSINRNAAIFAMDQNGVVTSGKIDPSLWELNPYSLGGTRTNHVSLLEIFDQVYPASDLIIIDMGDTTRVEQNRANCADEMVLWHRKRALERNDELLGELLQRLDLEHTMIILLSPNPNREMIARGNFGLSPLIFYHPQNPEGLITSSTTRRAGLITNMDILPTIMNFWPDENAISTIGSPITNVKGDHRLSAVHQHLDLLIKIRSNRSSLHYAFIVLALLTIIGGFWLYLKKTRKISPYFHIILTSTMMTPLIILFLRFSGYPGKAGSIFILLAALLLFSVFLNSLLKNPLHRLLFISGITTCVISIDCLLGSPLMLYSVLGSDAIAGGRYYGIGNDYMGVLISTSLIFILLLMSHFTSLPGYFTAGMPLLFMIFIAMVIGYPHFGANVGGLISALITAGILFILLTQKKINLKKGAFVLIFSMFFVILIAKLDAMYSSSPSHAGRAIANLVNGGAAVFIAIVRTKLGILGSTIVNSPWTFVLSATLLMLGFLAWNYHYKKSELNEMLASLPDITSNLLKILLIAGIVVFIFNDTGVIAASFILLYLISTLWIVWEHYWLKQQKGGPT